MSATATPKTGMRDDLCGPGASRSLRDPADPADLLDRGVHEHYEDADLYDFEYRRRRRDVSFYRSIARELLGDDGGRVLELACGSGRVTTALLRDGHGVVGLDLSQAMLRRAAARIERLGQSARRRAMLLRGDVRQFALASRFPLVVMAFNAFEHLYTRVEVAACLERVRDHLEPGGRFVFDVQNPNLRWLSRDPSRRWARTVFRHPRTGKQLAYSTNHDYDPVSQIALIRLYYTPVGGGREKVVHLSQRKFFPAELEALVSHAGFAVDRRHGDFAGQPLDGDAESQVLVCRVRADGDRRRDDVRQSI
ncbi:MAG TPA: methyltransferase domain-containing protein [Kofleriaceae bacterium]|nr:methyltransferase domain-containing protein [Kofleriaceae bacterium]